MSKELFENNIDKEYCRILNDVDKNGYWKGDRTNTGTKSMFGNHLRFNTKEGFPLLTQKSVYFNGVETELHWFMKGLTNIRYLTQRKNYVWVGDAYKKYLKEGGGLSKNEFIEEINNNEKFSKKHGEMGPIYGYQWRNGNIDQLRNSVELINNNPDSRRIIVDSWNTEHLKLMTLPPCHNQFQFWTRELSFKERCKYFEENDYLKPNGVVNFKNYINKINIPKRELSIRWSQRSVDTGLGLPFNIASYALLLEYISKLTNTVKGDIIGHFGDVHIYKNHYEKLINNYRSLKSYKLPTIEFSDKIDFSGFDSMIYSLDKNTTFVKNYKNNGKFPLKLNN